MKGQEPSPPPPPLPVTPPTVSPQLERYIQTNLRSQLAQARQHVVQNQTAAVLELGTSLLNQTTAQAHRLTDMEAQVPGVSGRHPRACGRPGWLTAQFILP